MRPTTTATSPVHGVPAALLDAAQEAARDLGKDVAEVPLVEIAKRAGISRSTLLRRLGGTRASLDEALRAAGVDPGGQRPVRERAIDAGGRFISRRGLSAATLEAVATEAGCSVYSLYSTFGGRSGLLEAIFERYRPTLPIDADTEPGEDPTATMTRLYMGIAEVWTREPRILPAILAEVLADPHDPATAELLEYAVPRSAMADILDWLNRPTPRSPTRSQVMRPIGWTHHAFTHTCSSPRSHGGRPVVRSGRPSMRSKSSRSEATRIALMEATLQVIMESGVKNVTHRKVCSAAEVSLGTVNYHYADLDELILDAFAYYVDRISEKYEGNFSFVRSDDDLVEAVIDMTRQLSNDTKTAVLMWEMYARGGRDRMYRQLIRKWSKRAKSGVELYCSPRTATTLEAVWDGCVVQRIVGDAHLSDDELREVVLGIIRMDESREYPVVGRRRSS